MQNTLKFSKVIAIILLTSAFLSSSYIFATNGYFTHGNGTKNKGQAGAGIANPDEAMAITNNPASVLLLGNRIDAGASIFNPRRNYNTSTSQAQGNGGAFTIGPNSLESAREFFVIPHVALTKQLDDDTAWGLAFYGRGGMNTRWEGGTASFDPDGVQGPTPVSTLPGTFGFGTTGVDLSQAFLDVSFAKHVNEKLSLGISGVLGIQAFKAEGLAAFGGFTEVFNNNIFATGQANPTVVQNLTNNGVETSFGLGAKIGVHYNLSPRLNIAAMYQTKISMTEFDEYSDLFAESGDFDIPANTKIGLSFNATDAITYSFDIEHTEFSEVSSVGNSIASLFACPSANGFSTTSTATCLGGSQGAGFGWNDMTVYKISTSWDLNDKWTLRAGYSHGEQPIPESQVLFNILAPAVIEDHATFGFTRNLANGNELNLALMYALENSINGINSFDPTQTIELEMDQLELELSYSWKL